MIFAQMKDGIVQNTVIIEDLNLLSLFKIDPVTGEQYDSILQIDQVYPQPGIGWSLDVVWAPPTQYDDGQDGLT